MLGQPLYFVTPEVVGFKLTGKLAEGATATDLALTVTQMLRKKGVVGKFVEFYGSGLSNISLADRATVANMAPEYGATIGFFPVDEETLNYLRSTGRTRRADRAGRSLLQSTRHVPHGRDAGSGVHRYDRAGSVARSFRQLGWSEASARPHRADGHETILQRYHPHADRKRRLRLDRREAARDSRGEASERRRHQAADWRCRHRGDHELYEHIQPERYDRRRTRREESGRARLEEAGLREEQLDARFPRCYGVLGESRLDRAARSTGFHVAGYGCATCIGNSGPLPDEVSQAIADNDLTVAAVLSGNRNFEGRVHAQVRANYLGIAAARRRLRACRYGEYRPGERSDRLRPEQSTVYLKDIWPPDEEITRSDGTVRSRRTCSARNTSNVFTREQALERNRRCRKASCTSGMRSPPTSKSRRSSQDLGADSRTISSRSEALRALALIGDSVTTDHISPAGNIKADSPAGKYLIENGVERKDFNSYGSRRGNHEVMMRGTFANIRIRNQVAPGTEGGVTTYLPTGEVDVDLRCFDEVSRRRHAPRRYRR